MREPREKTALMGDRRYGTEQSGVIKSRNEGRTKGDKGEAGSVAADANGAISSGR